MDTCAIVTCIHPGHASAVHASRVQLFFGLCFPAHARALLCIIPSAPTTCLRSMSYSYLRNITGFRGGIDGWCHTWRQIATARPLRASVSAVWLRENCHRPKLAEMGIKRESLLDPEPLHDHPADTVRKTPALIVIALEGLPRVRDILGEDPDDLCNLLRKERGAYPESPLKLPPHFHQG